MKNPFAPLFLVLFLLVSCNKTTQDSLTNPCVSTDIINEAHSKATGMQQILDNIVAEGVPGVSLAIYTAEGYWAGASGVSKIETGQALQTCHWMYGQSVAKTYMATAILMLYDEGKIDLGARITKYLPDEVSSKISEPETIDVRQLLNHTSGIPEYNDKPAYVTFLLQHPEHSFSTMDYLDFIDGDALVFDPGSEYRYTNTNYLLLALIADHITGDHTAYIRENILEAHGLTNSCYHQAACFDNPDLVNSYWDRYSNHEIENCSDMQKINVASLIGDDGIIATPINYVRFLKTLFDGQIISEDAMEQMLTFVDVDGTSAGYGLGIHKEYYNGFADYGHTGGGIGSGCILSYYPDKNAYIFLGINIGTSVYSPNFDNLDEQINGLLNILLE